MNHKLLPLTAAGLLVFAMGNALYHQLPEPEPAPPVPPPVTPFGRTVAGAGLVEPNTEASGTGIIAVGSQMAGVVTRVGVHVGQEVKVGDVLFVLDKRQAEAELRARQAALDMALAQMRKLGQMPRPEEVPVSEAQVRSAEAAFRQQEDQRNRDRKLAAHSALSQEDLVAHEQHYQAARAQLDVARANLALLQAGAWDQDKAIASASIGQARAQVDQAETMLRLLEVRAPVEGTILEVKVRPGEYVCTASGQSLILMGNLQPLHVRVNVDEGDFPRLKLNAPARAKIRGDATLQEIPLRYVRLEEHVVPKTGLTGANAERVDTRVVQVIYAIERDHRLVHEKKVLVGQVLDVFIDDGTPK
jgi:multidrug resistance efflux pump